MDSNDQPRDWRPSASLPALQLRARVLRFIHAFFEQRNVMEVETPLLCSAVNPDPHIDSFITVYTGPQAASGLDLYLQTSPEFAMKRLLCAGSGPIYQICKSFRQGERGAQHNPEFTILEWYRPGFDMSALIAEIDALMQGLFASLFIGAPRSFEATQVITYQEAFLGTVEIDPLYAPTEELVACLNTQGIEVNGLATEDRDSWLDVLMSHCVQPHLGRGRFTFVTDYPRSQAALAKVNPANDLTALRFELFFDGVELANGFHELGDPTEQRRRFEAELAQRQRRKQHQPPLDELLLQAMSHGLPDCAGVAVGLDRIIMLLSGARNLSQVLAFPLERV